MFDFLKKRNKTDDKSVKAATTAESAQRPTVAQLKFDFVEQYTLVHPKNVSTDYNYWGLCQTLPVWYEKAGTQSDFHNGVQLPTQVFLGYLNALKNAPLDIDPKMRTISIVNLQNNAKLFILPNLKSPKRPISVCEQWDLALNTTPEINRAIVEQLKMFTR